MIKIAYFQNISKYPHGDKVLRRKQYPCICTVVYVSWCIVKDYSCARQSLDARLLFIATVMYISGTQPMVLVSFVTLWSKNFDTSPLFLRDTFDAKMFRKWHPGKPNSKYTCQEISPVHYVQSYTTYITIAGNVRTFPGNTTKFIKSSDLIVLCIISLMHANS